MSFNELNSVEHYTGSLFYDMIKIGNKDFPMQTSRVDEIGELVKNSVREKKLKIF